MLLTVTYPNTLLPFQISGTKETCMRAVENIRKEGWDFHPYNARLADDLIYLHAVRKDIKPSSQRRFYVYQNKVLQQTACKGAESQYIKDMLALENNCLSDDINVISM